MLENGRRLNSNQLCYKFSKQQVLVHVILTQKQKTPKNQTNVHSTLFVFYAFHMF